MSSDDAAAHADNTLARALAVDRISDRYEAAWRSGARPALEAFLGDAPGPASAGLFRELLTIEVAYRLDRGETANAAEFLSTYPQYAREIAEVLASGDQGETTRQSDPRNSHIVSTIGSRAMPFDSLAPPAETPPVPLEIGKYRVIARLGSGGQAEVYRVIHPTLQHELVLKLAARRDAQGLDAGLLEAEGKLLAELTHPNLARVYDLGYEDGRPYLVMEYLRGRNLRQQLRQQRPSWRQSAVWTAKLARAVAAAHAVGVTHRDIKPDNVVLDAAGEPRLIDFGLAVVCDAWGETPLEPGVVAGSACFMAPEQARGEHAAIGPASDIFALGALLYYLLTGAAPFQSASHAGALERAAACEFDKSRLRQSGVPRRLRAVCLKAMAADPKLRHRSAEELAGAMESCLATRRARVQIAVAALLLVATVAAVGFVFRDRLLPSTMRESANAVDPWSDGPASPAALGPQVDTKSPTSRSVGRSTRRVEQVHLTTPVVRLDRRAGNAGGLSAVKQSHPALAVDGDGRCVIAWESESAPGKDYDVFAQIFASNGMPASPPMRVNSHTEKNQRQPSVAMAYNGAFVIAWSSVGQDGDEDGVFAQRFAPDGARVGGEFQVNTFTKGTQTSPRVAMRKNGSFLITWGSLYQEKNWDVFGQLYDGDGKRVGNEFLVNTKTAYNQAGGSIGLLADGGFVAAWQSEIGVACGYNIHAQRFSAAGEQIQREFQVNTTLPFEIGWGKEIRGVASNGQTRYAVLWTDYHPDEPQDGSQRGVYARTFDTDGDQSSPEFRVNQSTKGEQTMPSAGMWHDGTMIFAWIGNGQGNEAGVFVRLFDFDGNPLSDEMCVATAGESPPVDLTQPTSLGILPKGVVVAWCGKVSADRCEVFARWLPAPQWKLSAPGRTTAGSAAP